jgi:hypothetical protein
MADKLPPIKTEEDLKILSQALKKLTVEKALSAERRNTSFSNTIWRPKNLPTAAMGIPAKRFAQKTAISNWKRPETAVQLLSLR